MIASNVTQHNGPNINRFVVVVLVYCLALVVEVVKPIIVYNKLLSRIPYLLLVSGKCSSMCKAIFFFKNSTDSFLSSLIFTAPFLQLVQPS